jgi:hypothetical protein
LRAPSARFFGRARAAGTQRAMMMDVDQAANAMRDEEMRVEIEDFIEGFNQPIYRGMRVNGSGSPPCRPPSPRSA